VSEKKRINRKGNIVLKGITMPEEIEEEKDRWVEMDKKFIKKKGFIT